MSDESLCQRYTAAASALDKVDMELLRALAARVPALDYHSLLCDESDWDGVSLELYGVTPVGLILADYQLFAIWEMGFTVIRLYYEAPDGSAPRDGISDNMNGDWWAVKGRPSRSCSHRICRSRGGWFRRRRGDSRRSGRGHQVTHAKLKGDSCECE